MKKLLLVLALFTHQAWGAIAFVSCATNSAASGTTIVITASPANGSTVIVGYGDGPGTTIISTVTDNGSSTYSVPAGAASSANAPRSSGATALSVSGSPTSITVTASGTITNSRATACWWTGVSSIGNVGSSTAVTTSTNSNIALTMQDANNFNVCMMTIPAGATWTNNQGTMRSPATGVSQNRLGTADNTSASTGSLTCGATLSASVGWQASAIELRSSAGGASCVHTLTTLGAGCALMQPLDDRKYLAKFSKSIPLFRRQFHAQN